MFNLLWSNTKTIFRSFSTEEFALEFQAKIDPFGMFTEVRKA